MTVVRILIVALLCIVIVEPTSDIAGGTDDSTETHSDHA